MVVRGSERKAGAELGMRIRTGRIAAVAAAFALVLGVAGAEAATCKVPSLGKRHTQPINVKSPDQSAFHEAVLHYVNLERCRNGRVPFASDGRLAKMAAGHSDGMARTRTFSHKVPRSGYTTMKERLSRAGVKWRAAAENIAKNFVYSINGKPISTKTGGKCVFYYAGSGKQVPKHSYASLAQAAVAQWMNSPGHRKNIMDRRFNRTGAGLAVDTKSATCGEVYLTQNFAN